MWPSAVLYPQLAAIDNVCWQQMKDSMLRHVVMVVIAVRGRQHEASLITVTHDPYQLLSELIHVISLHAPPACAASMIYNIKYKL